MCVVHNAEEEHRTREEPPQAALPQLPQVGGLIFGLRRGMR